MYPSLRQLQGRESPLSFIATGKKAALPDISYYLSHGRYLIHICIVRNELSTLVWLDQVHRADYPHSPAPGARALPLGQTGGHSAAPCETFNALWVVFSCDLYPTLPEMKRMARFLCHCLDQVETKQWSNGSFPVSLSRPNRDQINTKWLVSCFIV